MKVLLCAATEMEIASTIRFIAAHRATNIEIIITGVGMLPATYSLTKAVGHYRPDFILQVGIAGYLDETLSPGSVVAVKTETVGDAGVLEENSFRSLFDMQLVGSNVFPWKNGQLENGNEILSQIQLPLVDSVTVNEISTNPERISYYRYHLQSQIESMEGAALHYVALAEKVPFLQLRSLSNFIGDRDKTKWRMKEAITNLNSELQNVITKHFIP